MTIPKPIELKPQPDFKLWIRYSDGKEGVVDLSHLAGRGVFSIWNQESVFESAKIGKFGQIAWSDEVDICADSLYLQITGQTIEKASLSQKNEVDA